MKNQMVNINHTVFEHILIIKFFSFGSFLAVYPNKQILAVFREWTSSSVNDKVVSDRISRDKIKKIKNLLSAHLPAEHLVTLR